MLSKSSLVVKDPVSEVSSLSHFLSGSVLLCSPGWPRTHDPPASASRVLGIQMYSSYTIISVLLSWLNQPFPMVGWPFTRDEYPARWGGGPSQRLAPKTGHICSFQPEAEVAACRTRECFQVPLGRQSFRVTCLRQFQSRRLSR